MDKCVFCGYEATRFPPEHWASQWLADEIANRSEGVAHNILGVPQFTSRKVHITLKHVCGKCNSTWMSAIESQAKKHVLPMILGDYSEGLTPKGLEHVLRWCYLKAICLEIGRPSEHPPTHSHDVYAHFRKTRFPAFPNSSLALGARDIDEPNPHFFVWASQSLAIRPEEGADPIDWYHTTVLIGHLVIDLIGTHEPHHLNVEHLPGLQVLWPVREGWSFTWPPEHRFSGLRGTELY
jgi:hypothetical protein